MLKNETKKWTLLELEKLVGKEQLSRLFLEHYLILIGEKNQNCEVADHLELDDIME